MNEFVLYNGAYNGPQVDAAISRALAGGAIDKRIDEIESSPLVAATVADMTDENRVYVYTGSEAGYTAGHWYYWDDAAWTDGGVYQSAAADAALSDVSVNPVQNRVVKAALDLKADKTEAAELQRQILASFPTDTASGSVASFPDGADDIPVKALTVNIDPVQSGSGDPSPTNVRSISGWTGANVTRTNANMFLTLPVASGQKRSAPIGIVVGTKYTIETTVTGYRASTNAFVVVYDRNGNELASYTSSGNINLGIDPSHPLTFTAPEGAVYCKFVFFKSGVTTCPFDPSNTYMHTGNPVGAIVAGVNNTYPVSWQSEAGTVYGGTLTDNGDGTWTLTVDRAGVDMGTLSYTYDSENTRFSTTDVQGRAYYQGSQSPLNICSCYTVKSMSGWSGTVNHQIALSGTAKTIYIMDTDYTDGSALQTALSGQIFVYELATPVSYTLTAETVKTLLGDNNIFADTGDVAALTYRADTTLYIDKRLSEV